MQVSMSLNEIYEYNCMNHSCEVLLQKLVNLTNLVTIIKSV